MDLTISERKGKTQTILFLTLTTAFKQLGWKAGDQVKQTIEGGNIVIRKKQ